MKHVFQKKISKYSAALVISVLDERKIMVDKRTKICDTINHTFTAVKIRYPVVSVIWRVKNRCCIIK